MIANEGCLFIYIYSFILFFVYSLNRLMTIYSDISATAGCCQYS